MKVLHVINNLTYGGAEKLLIDIINCQIKQGLQADLLLLNNQRSVYKKEDLPEGCNLFISSLKHSIYHPVHFFKIKKLLPHYDAVHVHLFPSQYWVSLASKFTGSKTKIITTEHATFNKRMRFSLFKPIERWIYRSFFKIVCISDDTKQAINRWINLKDRTLTILNGISIDNYLRARKMRNIDISPQLSEDDRLIIMVARFTWHKDHYTLFEALASLPECYKLLLAGDGEKKEEYISFCKKRNLEERIIFLGFRKDIPEVFKSCGVSVLSSNWEGFGLAAVESMAAGVPVIASDIPGLNQVVAGAGVLFEKGNSEDLAKKILQVFEDKGYRDAIIALQYERANHYNIEHTALAYSKLYGEAG